MDVIKMKFILIVTDESTEKTQYFGPFDDGEEALDWGLEHFDDNNTMSSTTLYDPTEQK
jgi:hypothetical protein